MLPLCHMYSVKYLGFMFTPDSKDDVDMQMQLKTFYDRSDTILRQFAKCDESVKLALFGSFCSCYYCPYLWLDLTKHSARILRVAYNNVHRKILKLHMRCSASQMFADNNLLNFEALMRKMSNTFINIIDQYYTYLLFFQLSFVFSIQIDRKNLANIF